MLEAFLSRRELGAASPPVIPAWLIAVTTHGGGHGRRKVGVDMTSSFPLLDVSASRVVETGGGAVPPSVGKPGAERQLQHEALFKERSSEASPGRKRRRSSPCTLEPICVF